MSSIQINRLMILAALFLSLMPSAYAAEHEHHTSHSGHDHTRPGSHAPIGVMGDHLVNMSGANFTTEAKGIGNVKLAATYDLFAKPCTIYGAGCCVLCG